MSSSRSIAAARQKRAGEQSSNSNVNSSRPVTSISSSSVFSQQQQQQRQTSQGNPKYNQINTNAGRQQRTGSSQSQSQSQSQLSSSSQQKQLTKISLPDAIGLITLRLGKLEKFIQESMEDGSLSFMSSNSNNNDYETNNMKLVSDEVFENITNRLDNLEKKK